MRSPPDGAGPNWQRDFDWQKQFEPLALDVIGNLPNRLFNEVRVAPRMADIKRATDLVMVRHGGEDFSLRLRRPGYLDSYGLQFTVRTERLNGVKTELAKYREGFGHYFFYGHIEHEWRK